MNPQELALNKKYIEIYQQKKDAPEFKQAYYLSAPGLTGKQDYQR